MAWTKQSPHTSNRHLAHNHPPHRETNSPTRVRGKDWGSYLHPPCRPNQLTEDCFHRRHWIYGINHQTNARQHRLRHADNNESQNSKRRPYQSSQTLLNVIPSLRRNYNFTFYIADVNDNILGLDFLKDKDININCRNLTVTDNLHEFEFVPLNFVLVDFFD